MTHSANKRRTHNDAARAVKQAVDGRDGKATKARRSRYGKRLEAMRARARGGEEE